MKIKKYDIAITKPWSKEMYDHNDNVLEDVKSSIQNDWQTAYHKSEDLYYNNGSADEDELDFSDSYWENANEFMINIQKAIMYCGYNEETFTIDEVQKEVMREIESMAYWRAKEISEDLSLSLSKEFIGLG
jgi:hypothetical protein